MKYMVMECHRAYAVVLDYEGRFLKVANLNYEVGQCVDHVVKMEEPRKVLQFGRMTRILSVAACLCLMVLGSGTYMMMPYGTVQIRINPHVEMTLNRLDYVTDLEGLNEDGRHLIEGTSTFGKKAEELTDELADKAMDMGYLSSGGRISLTVESKNGTWRISTEERIRKELDTHLEGKVEIVVTLPDEMEQTGDVQPGSVQPGPAQTAEPSGAPVQNKVVIPIGPDSSSGYGAAEDDPEDDGSEDDNDSDDDSDDDEAAAYSDTDDDDADDDDADDGVPNDGDADDAADDSSDDDIITYEVSEAAAHNAGAAGSDDSEGDDDSNNVTNNDSSDDDGDDDGDDDSGDDDSNDNDSDDGDDD